MNNVECGEFLIQLISSRNHNRYSIKPDQVTTVMLFFTALIYIVSDNVTVGGFRIVFDI